MFSVLQSNKKAYQINDRLKRVQTVLSQNNRLQNYKKIINLPNKTHYQ